MKRGLNALAFVLAWGVAAGMAMGGLRVAVEGYVALGLVVSSARLLLSAVTAYTQLAVAGALLALVADRLTWLAARLTGRDLGSHTRLLLVASVSLSLWPGIALNDRWLLPAGRVPALATLAGAALLHFGILLAGRRRLADGPRPTAALAVSGLAASAAVVSMLALLAHGLPALRADPARPNLLLVVLDTVRADRLSSYGYPRPTSPEIDAFAEGAIRFSDFYSTSSWTIPSHASLFTGLFPSAHGAVQTHLRLDRGHTTLAELLSEEGFRTWAASGNPFVDSGTQLDQGFETFVRTWSARALPAAQPHRAVAGFRRFLARAERDRPFFAFINLMEAHAPHTPPAALRRIFLRDEVDDHSLQQIVQKPWTDQFAGRPYSDRELRVLSDLYDGEIAQVSRIFGQILDALIEDGRDERTWVVLTSDHGEHFGENGRVSHMFTLYNVAVRVPLFIRPPGGADAPREDPRPGQLVDLFPTILALLGVDRPTPLQHGQNLLAPGPGRETILSEYHHPAQVLALFSPEERAQSRERLDPHRRSLRALQRRGTRLIWSSDGRHELYDLERDPGETHNLYDPQAPSPAGEDLLELLGALSKGNRAPDATGADESGVGELDERTRDALRSLGYVR